MSEKYCRLGRFAECDEKKCALWDEDESCCALLSVAKNLGQIKKTLREIDYDLFKMPERM